jgi:hypothetical protein
MVFENRTLRKLYGPKEEEETGTAVNCIMRSLVICKPYKYYWGDKINRN